MSEYHEFDGKNEHDINQDVNLHSDSEGFGEPAGEQPTEVAESPPAEKPVEEEQSKRSTAVLDLIAGVEEQLEQMRHAQSACVEEIESIESRKQNISDREEEIVQMRSTLDEQESQLQGRQADLDRMHEEVAAKQQAMESQQQDILNREQSITERSEQLSQQQEALASSQDNLNRAQSEFHAEKLSLESERASLRDEMQRLSSNLDEAKARSEQSEQRCEELQREHSELIAQRDTLTASLEATDARVAKAESAIQTVQAESLELSNKLEEAASVIERRDCELEAARGEAAANLKVQEELRGVLTTREDELNDLQGSFELATERLQALANAVAEQAPRLEEGAAAAALCRQYESRIELLNNELKEAQSQSNQTEHNAESDGQYAAAQEELARIRLELEDSIPLDEHQRIIASLESQVSSGSDGESVEDRALRAEYAQKIAELEALQAHADACESAMRKAESNLQALQERNEQLERISENDSENLPEDAVRLREQAQRLSSFAVHLQRRRTRLREVRTALKDRKNGSSGAFEAIRDDHEHKANQEELLKRRHELSDLESKMVRRWARHGTASTVLRISILVFMVGLVSWLSVRWFAPGAVSASALVRAQPVAGGVVDDARGTAWNDWHSTILQDKLFADAVAARLAASPAGFSGNGDTIQKTLTDQLEVAMVQPGMLQLRLFGTSPTTAVRELEAIVATLSAESQRQLPRRGDGARAEIVAHDGRLVGLDPVDVSGDQIQTAGMVFGGSLAGIGLLSAAVYSRLSRSRRIFDENVGFDEDELS